eukprot:TRINITY_DN19371_c0_g1_i2.p1 TRINITY_DN19371_c0_g1~~TRINITY_DN19371_c0_g1_i2.p1  ORF type:complete len:194 (-),score=41.77 TRINITY_DN19371_c0_g1_i2:29-589(-)
MEDQRGFLALLNGVLKRHFENDTSISAELVHEKVFPQVPVEEVKNLFDLCANVLREAVRENWEPSQLETHLQQDEQTFSATQRDVFLRFWQLHRRTLHESVVKQVTWNNSLKKFAWRIDVQTKTKNSADVNEPIAIVELNIDNKSQPSADGKPNKLDIVRFEMDKAQLANVLSQIQNIEKQIESRT